jgi:fructose-1,6-bisphosphatase/inositol monophosphatase family enzyme
MASGRLHGVNFRTNRPWDYEPGLFICKMAGAKIKTSEGFHAAAMNQEFLDILEKETALEIDNGR